QRKRLTDRERSSCATIVIMTTVAQDGQEREVVMIDLDTLPMWLARIDVNRVAETVRLKLIRFQKEGAPSSQPAQRRFMHVPFVCNHGHDDRGCQSELSVPFSEPVEGFRACDYPRVSPIPAESSAQAFMPFGRRLSCHPFATTSSRRNVANTVAQTWS